MLLKLESKNSLQISIFKWQLFDRFELDWDAQVGFIAFRLRQAAHYISLAFNIFDIVFELCPITNNTPSDFDLHLLKNIRSLSFLTFERAVELPDVEKILEL